MEFIFLCLTSFVQHNVFEMYPLVCISSSPFLLLSSIPLYRYTSLFIHVPVDGRLDCFHSCMSYEHTYTILMKTCFHFSWVNT